MQTYDRQKEKKKQNNILETKTTSATVTQAL